MAKLTINDSFSTSLFQFKMTAPYYKEYQHEVQNGNTNIDRIAVKDRFEITFPFVGQEDYNALMGFLQSLTSPFLKVKYETDEIVRLWDGSTAFASDTLATITRTAYYNFYDYAAHSGLMVAGSTTNLFTNPNGDDGSLTGVELEDTSGSYPNKNLTLTNSQDFHLWGAHSFKADNTAGATYAPASGDATVNASDGRTGFPDSGSLTMKADYDSLLLYNGSSFSDDAHWTTARVNLYDLSGSMGSWFVVSPSSSYRTETISPASDTYTFQLDMAALRFLKFLNDARYYIPESVTFTLTVDDLAGQSATASKTFAKSDWVQYQTSGSYGKYKLNTSALLSVTKAFSASGATSLRCRIQITGLDDGGSDDFTPWIDVASLKAQLVKLPYPMPYVATTSATVTVAGNNGLTFTPLLSMFAYDGQHFEPGPYGGAMRSCSASQSTACWFRSNGWHYDQRYSQYFTIFQSDGGSLSVQNGYLKLSVAGASNTQYDITGLGWSDMSWHHVCVAQSLSDDKASMVTEVYLDGTVVITKTVDVNTYWGSSPVQGLKHFTQGSFMAGYYQANITISEFSVGPAHYGKDKANNYPDKTILQCLLSDKATASIEGLVKYDENFAFYLQGNSVNAYAARSVLFDMDTTGTTGDKFSFSCYVLPKTRSHNRVVGVFPYDSGYVTGAWFYGIETLHWSVPFPAQSWTRTFMENFQITMNQGTVRASGITVPIGETYYVCGVQFEKSSWPTPYCDGGQLNCSWLGSVFASKSSRTYDYLTVPMPASVSGNNQAGYSVAFSFNLPDIGDQYGSGYVCSLGDGLTNRVMVTYDKSSGTVTLATVDNYGNSVSTSASVYLGFDQDHVAAIVRDPSTNRLSLYLDKNLAASQQFVNLASQLLNPSNFYPGSSGPTWSSPAFNSIYVAQIAIYSSAMTSAEAAQFDPFPQDSMLDFSPFPAYFGEMNGSLAMNTNNKVNADVKRMRNKCFLPSGYDHAHLQNLANRYEIKLKFQEA